MKNILLIMLCAECICCAQLMPQKPPEKSDSIKVTVPSPAMLMDDQKNSAMDGALDNMGGPVNNNSLSGTLIGIGAGYVGEVVREMLSPESPEAHARELERSRQR